MEIVPILGIMVPITALMIPIVAILTTHQRRMAEIIHQRSPMEANLTNEIRALRAEVAELRERVNQQTIALDTFAQSGRPPAIETLQQRLDA